MKKRKMKMPETTILVNSFAWLKDENYPYDYYKEWCEMNDREPADENSDEYFQWKVEQSAEDVECDLENIKCHKHYQTAEYVITGNLGLWNGRPSIKPVRVTGLYEAIMKCCNGCDDIDVTLNNKTGVIDVCGHHHDGTNCFEIRELKRFCESAYERAEEAYNWGDAEEVELKMGWFKKIENLYWVA